MPGHNTGFCRSRWEALLVNYVPVFMVVGNCCLMLNFLCEL
jgi:hypothetical protein